MKIKNWEWQQKWLQKRNMNFYLESISNRHREIEKNNRLRNQRRENQEEAKESVIVAQQSITQNRWKCLGAIFNSPITYNVLQLVEEEVVIIIQINVEEVNISTSDGIQQSMQTSSLNIDHEYQKPTEELNTLLLNTPKAIINAFGIINQVTKEGWP